MRRNFDKAKFQAALNAAIRAGHGRRLLQDLASEGIAFDQAIDTLHLMPFAQAKRAMADAGMAFDAPPVYPQSPLVTQASAGIPNIFTTWVDPKAIEVLVSPMMAAIIAGESQKGDWADDVVMFKMAEATGETSMYGDYSRSGSTDVNYNFPQRQNVRFQAFLQYGDLEVARAAKAKIDLPADKQSSNALALMKAMNFMNFFGVGNLQNFGLITDPGLQTPITATYSWLTSASATAATIYQDVVRLYVLLQQQSNGAVNTQTPMTLAMSNDCGALLNQVTLYNTNSVLMLLTQNYPNLRLETAPEYATQSGNLVQLIVDELDGQPSVECAFSVKMMAHRMVQQESSVSQKRTSAGQGAVWYRPVLCAQMYV